MKAADAPFQVQMPSCFAALKAPSLWVRCLPEFRESFYQTLGTLPDRGLAVVGTRRPQFRSLKFLQELLQSLQNTDLVILSGLALGIDTHAHEWAIRSGLKTWGILANGLDHIYPRQNTPLAEQILRSGGALLSESAPHQLARPHLFLQRNRLIAGLSQATCILEAGQRSGALNTAYWARALDRRCFVMPCFPGEVAYAGNQKLLDEQHAEMLWGAKSLGSVWLEWASGLPMQADLFAASPDNQAAAAFLKTWMLENDRVPSFAEALEDWITLGNTKDGLIRATRELIRLGLMAGSATESNHA